MVVFIMGPTGVGKSKVAMNLAREINGEIISVDSALVYRGLDIGTAKPSPIERKIIPHHLIDICSPEEDYSVGRFVRDSSSAIKMTKRKGRVPILVGGTNLYFRGLEHGLSELPQSNLEIRKKLQMEVAEQGVPSLHHRLSTIDPVAASSINRLDVQRIVRALEVYEVTRRPISYLWSVARNKGLAEKPNKFIILPDSRTELHEKIERRFVSMIQRGFINEVKNLCDKFRLKVGSSVLKTVGYKQIWNYLNGEYDLEEMKYKAVVATRQLAKRQITWLKRERNATIMVGETAGLDKKIGEILRKEQVS